MRCSSDGSEDAVTVAVDDPYNASQGLLRQVHYEGWGDVSVLGSPIQLRDPGATRDDSPPPTPPPRLGEHNREVFGGLLGLSDAELDELERGRII